ncbi:MAG: hypothetical protein JST91_13245 [Actinobacteria bacterium]|nr:hypothetical protein [Actinomycetota bacterium]
MTTETLTTPAASWRDLADQLTPETCDFFERAEAEGKLAPATLHDIAASDVRLRQQAAEAAAAFVGVPVPDGAHEVGDPELDDDGHPFRDLTVVTTGRGDWGSVRVDAAQRVDGTLYEVRLIVDVSDDWHDAATARVIGDAVSAAADHMARLADRLAEIDECELCDTAGATADGGRCDHGVLDLGSRPRIVRNAIEARAALHFFGGDAAAAEQLQAWRESFGHSK